MLIVDKRNSSNSSQTQPHPEDHLYNFLHKNSPDFL